MIPLSIDECISWPVFVFEDFDIVVADNMRSLVAGVEIYDINNFKVLDRSGRRILLQISKKNPNLVEIAQVIETTDPSDINELRIALINALESVKAPQLEGLEQLSLDELIERSLKYEAISPI